ncbi:MAG: hypothetical protein AB1486_11535 [Planctomycetota bacterium]
MKKVNLALSVIALCALFSLPALASWPTPASLLVFPIYDSQPGMATLITVTNTNADQVSGAVYVEFVYIDGQTCAEFNRTERLSPNDTITLLASAHNAESNLGYLYVFAKTEVNGEPMDFDYLIGNEMVVNGFEGHEGALNPFGFQGLTGYRVATDLDQDGILDLDGQEYEMAPDEILIPRFLGQSIVVQSYLAMVNLTGGAKFLTTLDFLVYNDHEQQFSAEYTFYCWARPYLTDISGVFTEYFLDWSTDDLDEIIGIPSVEAGWMRINGGITSSTTTSINDPAFLAALVETIAAFGGADLPFAIGSQDNGDLLPRSVNGDS